MPTDQPNNAPDLDGKPDASDRETATRVIADDATERSDGGGGLMGADAGGTDAGTAMGEAGAATPNSPIDAELPLVGGGEGDERLAEEEAKARVLDGDRGSR